MSRGRISSLVYHTTSSTQVLRVQRGQMSGASAQQQPHSCKACTFCCSFCFEARKQKAAAELHFLCLRERERLWVAALASCHPYYKKKWKVKFRMTQSLYKSFALGTKHKHQKFSFRMKVEAGMMQAFSAASWPTVTSFINCHVTFILMLVSLFFLNLYSVQHGCTNKFRGTHYRY